MVQAKVSPDLIILAISGCEPHFELNYGNTQSLHQLGVNDDIVMAMVMRQQSDEPSNTAAPAAALPVATQQAPKPTVTEQPSNKPRVFLQAASHGNMWNARRDQSMEMSKDFERGCPGVRITLNQQNADYTVALNHIEVGYLGRDNQFQVADKNGDLVSATKEGGSIRGGVKKACEVILTNWNGK